MFSFNSGKNKSTKTVEPKESKPLVHKIRDAKKPLEAKIQKESIPVKNTPVIEEPIATKVTKQPSKAKVSGATSPLSKAAAFVKAINFGLIFRGLLTLVVAGIFLVGIPLALQEAARPAQALLNSANFSIDSNETSDSSISKIKRDPQLKTDGKGRTNILIVGVDTREITPRGGGNVSNTDSMIVASYDHKTNRISLIATPRDLVVNYPNSPSTGKINGAYAIGNSRNKGGGLEYLKQTLENLMGVQIQYYGMVNLKGFTEVINQLGGIEVCVEKSFTDYTYPTDNYRWQTVSFKAGCQTMNGDQALKYSRSRHSQQNGEGSDFARARRQQKVIDAVITKAQKQETLQNPRKIFEILNTLASYIQVSQITPEDIQAGINIARTKGKPSTYNIVLDPASANSTLIQVGGGGAGYTITAKAGIKNYGPIRQYVGDFVNEPTIASLNPTIPVLNGKSGNFYGVYKNITSRFFYMKFKNAGTTDEYAGNTIFNFGGDSFDMLGKYIASTLGASYVNVNNDSIRAPRGKGNQLVIVIGK